MAFSITTICHSASRSAVRPKTVKDLLILIEDRLRVRPYLSMFSGDRRLASLTSWSIANDRAMVTDLVTDERSGSAMDNKAHSLRSAPASWRRIPRIGSAPPLHGAPTA
jgi:hypothetical protein